MNKFLFCIFFISTFFFATAQTWQDTVSKIEQLFSRYKSSIPGAQLSISRNGQLIFSKAWGIADMEHNIPMTLSSVSEAGSVSKQFTAAAILMLEQEGKLSLDDAVRKYIPELPEYGNNITLRQMMQHTSGLKDWGAIADLAGWPRGTKTYNNNDALEIIARQKTLNHKPGAEYIYSNSNYNLFAIIVERVSGLSLYEYSKQKIFDPAGMKHTEWRANFRKVVPNRAIAYSKGSEGYLTTMPNEYVYGNGGLLTTTEDLIRWTNYYSNGKLGNPSLLQKQITSSKFSYGHMHHYAAGLVVHKFEGFDLWTHDGATAGYRANLDHFPALGLSIAFLSNTSAFDNDSLNLASAIRLLFVPAATVNTKNPNVTAYPMSVEKLEKFAGWYVNSRNGAGVRLFLKNGKLNSSAGGEMVPVAENIFTVGSNRIEYLPRNNRLHFINTANDTIIFHPSDTALIDSKTLAGYAGNYYSDDAESKLVILIKNGKLVIKQKAEEFELKPTYRDGFQSPFGPVWFEKDEKQNIARLKISLGRARNVDYYKMKN